jgi:hypothetical protein
MATNSPPTRDLALLALQGPQGGLPPTDYGRKAGNFIEASRQAVSEFYDRLAALDGDRRYSPTGRSEGRLMLIASAEDTLARHLAELATALARSEGRRHDVIRAHAPRPDPEVAGFIRERYAVLPQSELLTRLSGPVPPISAGVLLNVRWIPPFDALNEAVIENLTRCAVGQSGSAALDSWAADHLALQHAHMVATVARNQIAAHRGAAGQPVPPRPVESVEQVVRAAGGAA